MSKGPITLKLPVDAVTEAVFRSLAYIGRDPVMLPEDVDADELFYKAVPLGLANVVHDAYSADPRIGRPGAPFTAYKQFAREFTDIQRQAWLAAAREFEREGIPVLVLKGMYLFSHVYHGTPRLLADADVLIRPEDARRAIDILRDLGYRGHDYAPVGRHYQHPNYSIGYSLPGLGEAENFLRLCSPGTADHTIGVIPDGSRIFIAHVSLHENVTTPHIHLDDLWRNPQEITIGGMAAQAPSVAIVAWLYATRCYQEILRHHDVRAARYLADLVALTRIVRLPYDELVELAGKYGTVPALFYVLRCVRELGLSAVPDEVFPRLERTWRSARLQHRAYDGGDILPALLNRRLPVLRAKRVTYTLVPSGKET